MISSVIAKLNRDVASVELVKKQIESHPALEVGELVDGRMLPLTIEATGNQETEEITRWLLSLEGVAFVDVVYVHFEEEDSLSKKRGRKRYENSADSTIDRTKFGT